MKKFTFAGMLLLAMGVTAQAQNVGIGTATPTQKLHVTTNAAADGIRIDNIAANGDPTLQFQVNGSSILTMGVDDSDADKFKLGTTAITTNTRLTITTAGFIGINTTAPGSLLHMTPGATAVGAASMALFENTSTAGVALSGRNTSTTSGYNSIEGITDYNGSTYITAGVFGLGMYNGANSATTIGVRGHSNEWQGTGIRASRYNGGGANTGWGGEVYDDLGYTGFFGAISDVRTKKNIQPINGALAIVTQLRPVTYEYDLEKYPNMGLNRTTEFGFIAQEVQQVIPDVTRQKRLSTNATELVGPGQQQKDEFEEFLVMDYTRIIPILTQAIKEQQAEIEALRARIEQLEGE